MRWPWRRSPRPPAATDVLEFDASIDVPAEAAVDAVRSEVEALPGAGWISVEAAARAEIAVTVYPRGLSVQVCGLGWDAVRDRVHGIVSAALARQPASGFAEPAPGFDEAAMSPALRQLAALAALQQPRPDPAPQVVPNADETRLATLLGFVLPSDVLTTTLTTSQAAIRRFGSYAAVLAAPESELRRVPGLGTHCVAAIKLMHAAAIRLARAGISGRPVLESPAQLADYLTAAIARERIEQFRILFLDADGLLQADEVQARGTVNHTPVYPREVVRRALELGAASLILVHNHPTWPLKRTLAHA